MKSKSNTGQQTTKVPAYDKDGNYLGEFEKPIAADVMSVYDPDSMVSKLTAGKPKSPKGKFSDVGLEEPTSIVGTLISKASKAKGSKSQGAPALNADTSIVDFLKKSGEKSDYKSRKSLAETFDLGDGEYKGTAKQNTKLLGVLKSRKKPSEKKTMDGESPKIDEDFIKKQNEDSLREEDLQDGTWDNYMEYVTNSEGDHVPFAVYKKKLEKGLV